uniref:P-type ATPase C-terminal domain-containing protein n=1 Tax=Populus trichocarpa TaxID=3694 RepID=A0A2K1XIB0_POPTR
MLQEADISDGISGVEGMQAVMSSDITITQFRYLERLLLVHGHRCFRRISSMICYFFYKNIAFGFTLFFYEAYVSFSGQQAYNDWFLSLYNVVFFNSLPVIALGVFDQDVSAPFCLKILYGFREGGEVVIGLEILGTTLYTCIVLVVNCQMALSINYFTSIQHLFIWGGIVFWFIFLMVYGAILDPYLSTTAYKVFIEAPVHQPRLTGSSHCLCCYLSSLLPYFTYLTIQMRFFPFYHQMIP